MSSQAPVDEAAEIVLTNSRGGVTTGTPDDVTAYTHADLGLVFRIRIEDASWAGKDVHHVDLHVPAGDHTAISETYHDDPSDPEEPLTMRPIDEIRVEEDETE